MVSFQDLILAASDSKVLFQRYSLAVMTTAGADAGFWRGRV